MTKLCTLICEGACNPDLSHVDVRMAYDMAHYNTLTHVTIWHHRRLRYTTHVEVGIDEYRCGVCQTVRQYGHAITRIRPESPSLDNGAEPV